MKRFSTFAAMFLIGASLASRAYELPGSAPIQENFETKTKVFEAEPKFLKKTVQNYKPTTKKNYDALRYDLDLNWYKVLKTASPGWSGLNKIKLTALENNVSVIVLDAEKITIDKVTKDGISLVFDNSDQKLLKINLDKPININDTIDIEIAYTVNSASKSEGFVLAPKGYTSGNPRDRCVTYENIAYTMSEPRDARKWMPCNDISFDKALASVRIVVPKGYTAVSNGERIDSADVADSTIWKWANNCPIPTYLIAITASKFVSYKDYYTKQDGSKLPIEYYVWEKDLDNSTTRKCAAFDYTSEMVGYFSDRYFEYPYSKYGMVAVYPFSAGGMEHQSLTTIHQNWIDNRDYPGIAHELAHQWLGDYITCADWQDLWINEGGAVWSTNSWIKKHYGDASFADQLLSDRAQLFGDSYYPDLPIYNLDESDLFSDALTYRKAGWFYRMMSVAVGEEQFLKTLKKIFNEYSYKSLSTEQFRDIVKRENPNYPLSWDKFFEQWLLKPGYPKISTEFGIGAPETGKYVLTTKIKQTQDGVDWPDTYECAFDILIGKNSSDAKYYRHYITQREQIFTDTLNYYPEFTRIDSTGILAEINYKVTNMSGVENANIPISASILPTPANSLSGVELSYYSNGDGVSTIELYDEFSRKCAVLFSGAAYKGVNKLNLALPNLSAGMYYIKIDKGDQVEFIKTLIK
jgi:aminopeptidase N